MTTATCPVCDGEPRVLVAVRHPAMRRLTRDLLARDHGCWQAFAIGPGEPLGRALARYHPDLLVIDAADFPTGCHPALEQFPAHRVIVVGPEPDRSYRAAMLTAGAGGWISRERVAEELGAAMRCALGCYHDPCPSGTLERPGFPAAGIGVCPGCPHPAPRWTLTVRTDGDHSSRPSVASMEQGEGVRR